MQENLLVWCVYLLSIVQGLRWAVDPIISTEYIMIPHKEAGGSFMLHMYTASHKIWTKFCHFYTPVFRRVVLWYGAVRPSVRPSVHPSGGLWKSLQWSAMGGCYTIHSTDTMQSFSLWCLSPHNFIKQRKCQHTIIETVLLARNDKIKQSNETLSQFCTLHNHGPTHW